MKRNSKAAGKVSNSIQNEVSAMAEDLGSLGSTLGENASAEVKATIKSLRQRLNSIADDATGAAREEVDEVRSAIADNPFVAIGTAIGLGFVLAALIRR